MNFCNPNKYQDLRNQGKLHGTIKRAVALCARRTRQAAARRERPPTVALPLGPDDEQTASSLAYAAHPRKQNWRDAAATIDTIPDPGWTVRETDHGAYSSRCKWHRISYRTVATSYCHAFETRLVARIFTTLYKLRAPRGWRFGRDELGVYTVRNDETREAFRYHLESDDVRSGVRAIRTAGIAHEAGQRKAIKDRRLAREATKAERETLRRAGVWVSERDSRGVGNCRAGTATFARQNGLDIERHYPARILERLIGKHYSVATVISYAEKRTLRELRTGVCALIDH
jgi:hypothetical protein